MGRPRNYSDELRDRAIDELLERDRKVPEVAKQLGRTSPETLRRWVIQALVDRGLVVCPSTGSWRRSRRCAGRSPTSSERWRFSSRRPPPYSDRLAAEGVLMERYHGRYIVGGQ